MTYCDKIREYLDPTVSSVLQLVHPRISWPPSLEEMPWADFIAFLAFSHEGHTALSLHLDHLKALACTLFAKSEFSEEELSFLAQSVLDDLKTKEWARYDGLISLPFSHRHDLLVAQELHRLSSVHPVQCDERVASYPFLQALTDEQQRVIASSLHTPFSIIYGGPGTGKTYTAGSLVACITKRFHAQSQFRPSYRVLATAPTGKAVIHLKSSIEQTFHALHETIGLTREALEVDARTIHAFLLEQKRSQGELSYHAIIVDESSMIDTLLMGELLSQIHSGTRVIMLGDPDQLPPIDPGNPFCDIIRAAKRMGRSGLKTFELTRCMRTELQGIVSLAKASITGSQGPFFSQFEKKGQEETRFFSPANSEEVFRLLYRDVGAPWERSSDISIEEALRLSQEAKILSPTRQNGPMSTSEINRTFSIALQNGPMKRHVRPILITKNIYSLQCMNGDAGVIESVYPNKNSLYIPTSPFSPLSDALCPYYEHSYAMTIHKAQGSEFHRVFIVVPPGQPMLLNRRLLYTAITRAKREITIVGSRDALKAALANTTERMSCLSDVIASN